jgi:hypothetical protein
MHGHDGNGASRRDDTAEHHGDADVQTQEEMAEHGDDGSGDDYPTSRKGQNRDDPRAQARPLEAEGRLEKQSG